MKKVFSLLCAILIAQTAYAIEDIALQIEPGTGNFVERLSGGIEKVITTPKVLKFESGPINDLSAGFVYQGTSDMSFSEENPDLTTLYPLYFEIWTKVRFENEKSEIKIQVNPSLDVDNFDRKFNAVLMDLYYKRKLTEHNNVTIGNSKTPASAGSLISPTNLLLVKREQITKAHGNNRATGIKFDGDYPLFDYNVGGYFSTRYMQDYDDGLETTNWVNIKPFGKQEEGILKNLKIGGGINRGKNDGREYTVTGAAISWDYKKWLAVCEYSNANGSNGSKYSAKESQGVYGTVAYKITDKLQAVARYDVFDPDKTKPNNLKTQYTTGLNYYVLGQKLKFALNYMYEQNEAAKHNDKQAIYFLTQIQL